MKKGTAGSRCQSDLSPRVQGACDLGGDADKGRTRDTNGRHCPLREVSDSPEQGALPVLGARSAAAFSAGAQPTAPLPSSVCGRRALGGGENLAGTGPRRFLWGVSPSAGQQGPSRPISLHPVHTSFRAWVQRPVSLETEDQETCSQPPAWGHGEGFHWRGGACCSLTKVVELKGAHSLTLQAEGPLALRPPRQGDGLICSWFVCPAFLTFGNAHTLPRDPSGAVS